jgi:glycosyltransferase involved in cell wall biosynthesis
MDIWPARRIAKITGAKLVFEVHDLWPLSPMELGGLSKWHPFILWVQYAEDFAYRHSDKVISMLPNAKEHMISRGMAPEKYSHIPNGVALEDWKTPKQLPLDVSNPLDSLKQNGLPLVGYAGNFGLANALDLMLDTAVLLSGKAQFVLVGKGPDADRLASRIADEDIGNVALLPSIEKRAIPSFLEQIDIAYIGWRRNPLYRFGISPNKLMDYMMAGKPIVHAVCAGNDPVGEAGCGITVPPDDVKAVPERGNGASR